MTAHGLMVGELFHRNGTIPIAKSDYNLGEAFKEMRHGTIRRRRQPTVSEMGKPALDMNLPTVGQHGFAIVWSQPDLCTPLCTTQEPKVGFGLQAILIRRIDFQYAQPSMQLPFGGSHSNLEHRMVHAISRPHHLFATPDTVLEHGRFLQSVPDPRPRGRQPVFTADGDDARLILHGHGAYIWGGYSDFPTWIVETRIHHPKLWQDCHHHPINHRPMHHPTFLDRYSRQIRLPLVAEAGQQAIREASVLIVGLGGLGSPAAMYLAAAGVEQLTLADFDVVDPSNLQRQIAHTYADIGQLKTESAARCLRAINPDLRVTCLDYTLGAEEFDELAESHDVLMDCTDNFPTRFQLNDASLRTRTPLVSGAAIRWEGQVTAFDPRLPDSPCYQCLYPDRAVEAATCAAEGVISPLVGVIGTMQALEAINILLNRGQLHGAVWLFDAQFMEWQKMVLPRNAQCPACGSK